MANRFTDKLCGYAELSEEEIAALDKATSRPREHEARSDLIREGDQPGPVLVVLEGWAFRYKILPNGTRQIMAFLMAGDACDLHIGLLAEMDHSIQTVTKATVATISRSTMDDLMASYPRIARAMYIAQLVDEGTMRAWIVSLGRRSSKERAAHLLLELFFRSYRVGDAVGNTMKLPLSQQVLSDALGMTVVHINRVLQSLRRLGAIDLSRGVLHILDPAALTRIAGFDDSYLHKRMRDSEAP
jgi:CRP-like cAMP-binding protein